jgi:hypothetical protein
MPQRASAREVLAEAMDGHAGNVHGCDSFTESMRRRLMGAGFPMMGISTPIQARHWAEILPSRSHGTTTPIRDWPFRT